MDLDGSFSAPGRRGLPAGDPDRSSARLGAGRVYDWCMRTRTNIEIDDEHVRAIMARYGLRTKTEAVDLALRTLAGQPMSRAEALAMRGAQAFDVIADVPLDAPA